NSYSEARISSAARQTLSGYLPDTSGLVHPPGGGQVKLVFFTTLGRRLAFESSALNFQGT
ncbi:MAG: hypothetical protein KDA84_21385, partial [Planctomycetaceae bacterium]|nr:hypothetical protein [Planctomycetaceae bacterium]